MKTCRILCVCGSGTVSSNMVANKLRDQLGEAGWDCTTVETSPGGVETELMGNKYDIVLARFIRITTFQKLTL